MHRRFIVALVVSVLSLELPVADVRDIDTFARKEKSCATPHLRRWKRRRRWKEASSRARH